MLRPQTWRWGGHQLRSDTYRRIAEQWQHRLDSIHPFPIGNRPDPENQPQDVSWRPLWRWHRRIDRSWQDQVERGSESAELPANHQCQEQGLDVTLLGSTELGPMDHIEYALFSQACRLQGHTLQNSPDVRADLDCMAEAISTTCKRQGMNDEETAGFLLQAATIFHELGPEICKRKLLRRMERRLLQLIGPPPEHNSEDLM